MKQNLNKQPVTILSILLFSMGLLLSFNIFAQAGGLAGEIAARQAADAALQGQIDGLEPPTHAVGEQLPDGSIVFWVNETGRHGLAAWPEDEAGSLDWYEAGEAADAHGPGWRLPTKAELNLLFLQKDVVGGFVGSDYWSSTEFSSVLAWDQYFGSGAQGLNGKGVGSSTNGVRAVRAF